MKYPLWSAQNRVSEDIGVLGGSHSPLQILQTQSFQSDQRPQSKNYSVPATRLRFPELTAQNGAGLPAEDLKYGTEDV